MKYRRYFNIIIRDFSAYAGWPMVVILSLFLIFTREFITFWQLSSGIILINIVSLAIRLFKFRDRPLKVTYSNIIEKLDASSFPSIHAGHSTFMLILFSTFFSNIFITILLFLINFGVYYSRYYMKKHFVSDIIGGIIISVLVWYAVVALPVTIFPF